MVVRQGSMILDSGLGRGSCRHMQLVLQAHGLDGLVASSCGNFSASGVSEFHRWKDRTAADCHPVARVTSTPVHGSVLLASPGWLVEFRLQKHGPMKGEC